jgi:hypothetical protein
MQLLPRRLRELHPGDEADVPMPELEQVLGRHTPRGPLVDSDGRDGESVRAAVDEDDARAAGEQLPVVRVLAAYVRHLGADEDHALDPPLEQHLHVVHLAQHRAGRVAEDRGVADPGGPRFHRLGERGEHGIAELGHEQADRTGRLHLAGRDVEQLPHRLLDALPRLGTDDRRSADDTGCGRHANSCTRGDVSKRGRFHR